MKKRYFAGAAVAAMILTAGMAMTSFADWSQQNGKWYYYNDNNGRLVRNDWVCSKDAWSTIFWMLRPYSGKGIRFC